MANRQKRWPVRADIEALDAQLADLERRKTQLRASMSERFAVLAERTGLMELDIPDATLKEEFRALAERFRGGRPVQSVGSDAPQARQPAGKETAHGA